MAGLVALFAALASTASPAVAQTAGAQTAGAQAEFRPSSVATARATARIRIISGVRFGSDEVSGATGADRRTTVLSDAAGLNRPAEILEFQ